MVFEASSKLSTLWNGNYGTLEIAILETAGLKIAILETEILK